MLHLFVKAVRLNGSVLVRGAGWAESADRVHYHALHLEFLRQPGDVVRDALQPKFLYLRETGQPDAQEHEFRVEVLRPPAAALLSSSHPHAVSGRDSSRVQVMALACGASMTFNNQQRMKLIGLFGH